MQLPSQRVNVMMNDGGLGDRIAQMPAILYSLREFSHVSMDIWCPRYFRPLAQHFIRGYEDRVDIYCLDDFERLFNKDLPIAMCHNGYVHSLRQHPTDVAFQMLNGNSDFDSEIFRTTPKAYPKLRLDEIDTVKFNLPGEYVVLTPGYTALTRKLPNKVWNDIREHLTMKGITVVWLGAKADTIGGGLHPESTFDADLIIGTTDVDLRDKTTLLEAGKIMGLAKAVVGLDNGLLHLAACAGANIVAGYSSVDPRTRMPINEYGLLPSIVEPETSLDCRYCQTQSNFDFVTDFRFCKFGTYECIKQLTSYKFIRKLERYLR